MGYPLSTTTVLCYFRSIDQESLFATYLCFCVLSGKMISSDIPTFIYLGMQKYVGHRDQEPQPVYWVQKA